MPTRVRMKDSVMICVVSHPEAIATLARVLRGVPCQVLLTEHPDEALRWLGSGKVTLVLVDEWMKEMPGSRLLSEVRSRSPMTARFLIAGSTGSTDRVAEEGGAVHGVIGKPWDSTALRRTVLAILKWQEEKAMEWHPSPGQVDRRQPKTRSGKGKR